MNAPVAALAAILFFAPLAFVYGRQVAGAIAREARRSGRGIAAVALPQLVVPIALAAAFLYRIAGAPPSAETVASGTVRAALSLGWFAGSIAAILFFLTVPFAMGRLFGVAAALAGWFAGSEDEPLRFGASGFRQRAAQGDGEGRTMTADGRRVIAIDGPAAAGKGTLAARLARHYGLDYLDTGLLYRAVGRLAAERGVDPDDPAAAGAIARELAPSHLDDGSLRGREAGELASRVAVHGEVREALVAFQRDFAARPGGAVLDGRDIGTVICPDAAVKIFVTASAEVRARRRTDELHAKGRAVDYATILAEVRERDARDAGRSVAPLRPAADAALLDTSEMDIEAAFRAACAIVDATSPRNG